MTHDETPPSVPEEPAQAVEAEPDKVNDSNDSAEKRSSAQEAAELLPENEVDDSLFDKQYDHSIDHVWHELRRINWLIKAQIHRWKVLVGDYKSSDYQGETNVPPQEVDHLLRQRAVMPDDLTPRFGEEINRKIRWCWRNAYREAKGIQSRIKETEVELRLQTLWQRLGLFDLQQDIILVCLWAALDERYRRLYGYLMDDGSRLTPSLQLITQILMPLLADNDEDNDYEDDDRARLSRVHQALGQLLRWHIISLSAEGLGAVTAASRSVKLDERIVTYLLEHDGPDPRLSAVLTLLPRLDPPDPWQTVRQDEALKHRLVELETWVKARHNGGSSATLLLRCGYGSGQLQAARAMCHSLNGRFFTIDSAAALHSDMAWDELVTRVYREALLRNRSAVYWAGCEAVLDDPQGWQTLVRAAEQHPVVTFLESTRGWTPTGNFRAGGAFQTNGQSFVLVEFPLPSYELRVRLWHEGLAHLPEFLLPPDKVEELIRSLSSSFQFTEGQIADAITAARACALLRDADKPQMRADDLYEGCRAQSSHDLQTLAQRIEPRKSLTETDLVLPRANKRQFEELQSRIRHRGDLLTTLGYGQRFQLGRGLIALFTGSSGTGKTMGAEILGLSMGVAIYRVDLSAIVSKYVGETEKNINRVFQLAEGTGSILFFDEADALFGKRGEVREAQDRWANLEVNYLLQRVEQYSGVVILASNLRQNIDEAFVRRIHMLIDFPFPDEQHRLTIWEQMLKGRDKDQPDVRFPDAEYHGRFTPEYCALLETTVRAGILEQTPDINPAALEEQVQARLANLSRQRIRELLDPELANLSPRKCAVLLRRETRLLARRFQLAGGNIKNIVVDAATRALEEQEKQGGELHILLRHLIAATTREYQKLGKPVTRGEFGDPFYEWAKEDILS